MACHPLKMFEKRLLSSFRSVVLQDLVADHRADLLLITRPEAVGDLNTCPLRSQGKRDILPEPSPPLCHGVGLSLLKVAQGSKEFWW